MYGLHPFSNPISPPIPMVKQAVAITKGDLLLATATGVTNASAAAGTTDIIGVAAQTVAAGDATVLVYTNPAQIFIGTCSGTPTQALMMTEVDIEGAAGIMQVNEDATTTDALLLLCLAPGETLALNANVLVKINRGLTLGQND